MSPLKPFVDAAFRVQGGNIPADHASPVYAAISRAVPSLHQAPDLGIFPIGGNHVPSRQLHLTDVSRLRLRLPASLLGEVLKLAGAELNIGGSPMAVGTPSIHVHTAHEALVSRLVIIKGFMEADGFLEAVRRQLAEIECDGEPSLMPIETSQAFEGRVSRAEGSFVRRSLAIHGREIVGFAVRVAGLSADGSMRLQAHGVGGRRRFGCGLFVPLQAR